jgi:two-component system, OmpR family, sensor kinase
VTVSLRTRLLAGVLILVTGALVVAAYSIYAEQRSYLDSKLDQRVIAAAAPISFQLGIDTRQLRRPRPDERLRATQPSGAELGEALVGFLPAGTYGAVFGAGGQIIRGPVTVGYGTRRFPGPRLPSRLPISTAGSSPKLFTVGSRRGGKTHYRAAALALRSGNETLVVAVPSRDVDQTLNRLVLVEGLAVSGVIIVLIGLGWLMIRIALRPLDQMGTVASAISDGDLSRRVSPATPRTEVGRLGVSLNKMLVRIEEAFADRENSEERRRQFLSDASHELRTPLASIRGYAELFRLGPAQDPAALTRAMERIEAEATRMGVLVEDLLALARLDELPEARQERVDLTELASNAVADARAIAPDRKIALEAQGPAEVLGDQDALRQVLANLLGNAVLHTRPGTPIDVAVDGDGDSDEVVIEVRDRGGGLAPGTEERVFDRFWRGDSARGRLPGGSGLGLAIVTEILAAHHATVTAINRPDGGASFVVRLPSAPERGSDARTSVEGASLPVTSER